MTLAKLFVALREELCAGQGWAVLPPNTAASRAQYSGRMPLYWQFMPMLRASHATTTFQQASAGAEDWTSCADPVCGPDRHSPMSHRPRVLQLESSRAAAQRLHAAAPRTSASLTWRCVSSGGAT